MFKLKKGHQPGVYVPLRALFLVLETFYNTYIKSNQNFENILKSYLLCICKI